MWATFDEWKALGAHVRRGEKATRIQGVPMFDDSQVVKGAYTETLAACFDRLKTLIHDTVDLKAEQAKHDLGLVAPPPEPEKPVAPFCAAELAVMMEACHMMGRTINSNTIYTRETFREQRDRLNNIMAKVTL